MIGKRAFAVVPVLVAALVATSASSAPLADGPVVGSPAPPERPVLASALALPGAELELASPLRFFGHHRGTRTPKPAAEYMPLGADRARILLRSLTIPGWGQATLGHRHAAATFAVAEAGVWGAFTAFRVQELMRRLDYQRTARLFAGIDLSNRDEEYQRIVGAFVSSDEYNQFVVARDAANIYLTNPANPDIAGYRAYIAAHSIGGSDAWRWNDPASFQRFGEQRKNAQRAALRANTALAFAIANRIVSALHAMRLANTAVAPAHGGTSWHFEVAPPPGGDPLALRAGLRADF